MLKSVYFCEFRHVPVQVTFAEKPQMKIKEIKTFKSNSSVIRQIFLGCRCESGIVFFAWKAGFPTEENFSPTFVFRKLFAEFRIFRENELAEASENDAEFLSKNSKSIN